MSLIDERIDDYETRIPGPVRCAGRGSGASKLAPEPESILVNDIHSQLNSTRVLGISQPRSLEDVQRHSSHRAQGSKGNLELPVGRHAMGGQQFGTNTLLIDIRKLSRVLNLDRKHGILEVEAGIEWPELIDGYLALQNGNPDLGNRPEANGC